MIAAIALCVSAFVLAAGICVATTLAVGFGVTATALIWRYRREAWRYVSGFWGRCEPAACLSSLNSLEFGAIGPVFTEMSPRVKTPGRDVAIKNGESFRLFVSSGDRREDGHADMISTWTVSSFTGVPAKLAERSTITGDSYIFIKGEGSCFDENLLKIKVGRELVDVDISRLFVYRIEKPQTGTAEVVSLEGLQLRS